MAIKKVPFVPLCGCSPHSEVLSSSVDKDGNEKIITCFKNEAFPHVDYDEACKVNDLKTMLRNGIVPQHVDGMLSPSIGDSNIAFSELSCEALSRGIVNIESKESKLVESSSPITTAENEN